MQETYWNGLFDTRWEDAPFGLEAIRLVLRLRKLGYAEKSLRTYGQIVVHLGRVLDAEGKAEVRLLDEAVVETFVCQHLSHCACYRRPKGKGRMHARWALAHLLKMLREDGAIPPELTPKPPYHELLEGYSRFLLKDRGLAKTTVVNYRRYLRDFLKSRGDAVSPAELVALTSDELLSFGRQRGTLLGATAWNHLATALSGFYRWLDLQGHGDKQLVGAIPLRRRYRLAEVPCALSWVQVQQLLAVVDRQTPVGRRNYAILLLIATYGLRGCEVRTLRLDDINWSQDEITIFASKTGRRRKLPLTRPVGEAILDYLRHGRPPSVYREVFLSLRAPCGPMRTKINPWLRKCFAKAGIKSSRYGAHTLRHSLAVHLLRNGETLKSIGDVLGHRNTDTTFIYTKLHVEDLRTVALDPEVVS